MQSCFSQLGKSHQDDLSRGDLVDLSRGDLVDVDATALIQAEVVHSGIPNESQSSVMYKKYEYKVVSDGPSVKIHGSFQTNSQTVTPAVRPPRDWDRY